MKKAFQSFKKHHPFPTSHDLMWPTLMAIKQLGGSGTNEEIFDKIVRIERISEEVQSVPLNDRKTLLQDHASWARSYLKWIGALENSRTGVWAITAVGEKLKQSEIPEMVEEAKKKYHQDKKATQQDTVEENEVSGNGTEHAWKERLLETIKAIKPDAFERLCQRLLRESGFIKVEVTGKTNDGGIDGVGVLRVNLLSFQVSFQCKRYQGSVGSNLVRDFRGAMIGRCDKGLLITTGSFTSEARKEATRDGAPTIDLIDGEELCELLKRLKLGVEVKTVENVTVKQEWFEGI